MTAINESSNVESVKTAIEILNQALRKMDDYDYGSAVIMTGVAKQLLDNVQMSLEQNLDVQNILRRALTN
jgi:hypothetical protein